MALPTIEEAEATGEIAALYDDVRATMRSTFIPTVFRALAVHRAYLVPAWTMLRRNMATTTAETVAGGLRVACVDRLKLLVQATHSGRVPGGNHESGVDVSTQQRVSRFGGGQRQHLSDSAIDSVQRKQPFDDDSCRTAFRSDGHLSATK